MMRSGFRCRSAAGHAVLVAALLVVGAIVPACSGGDSMARNVDLRTTVVSDPPAAATASDGSGAFAWTIVPDGWGIVEAGRDITSDPARTITRTATVAYGRPDSLDIGILVVSIVVTDEMGLRLAQPDRDVVARTDRWASGLVPDAWNRAYPTAFEGPHAFARVTVFDDGAAAGLDATAILDSLYEISDGSWSSLREDLVAPGAVVATTEGVAGPDDEPWRFDAVLALRRPDARGGSETGCAVVRSAVVTTQTSPVVCASDPSPRSRAMLVDVDLYDHSSTGGHGLAPPGPFVIGVVESPSDSFTVRPTNGASGLTIAMTVLESSTRDGLRWVVAPVDASVLCWDVVDGATGAVVPVDLGIPMLTTIDGGTPAPLSPTTCGSW